MRKTFSVLAYLIAAEVVVQAMAIAYAIAGVGYWVSEEDGVLNKQVMESDDASFTGLVGFIVHGMNGMMIIPLLAILLLVFSFFAKVQGATRNAAIVLGRVVTQVVLGILTHSIPGSAALHALNAFAILVLALRTARGPAAAGPAAASVDGRVGASV